jgi:dihydroxy-acid dehydratase
LIYLIKSGFIIGHITPEAQVGGPIALIQSGDTIVIDAEKNRIDVISVSQSEMAQRQKDWVKAIIVLLLR